MSNDSYRSAGQILFSLVRGEQSSEDRCMESFERAHEARMAKKFGAALDHARYALELAESKKDQLMIASAVNLIALLSLDRGAKPKDEKYFRRSVELAGTVEEQSGEMLADALLQLVRYLVSQKRWSEAESALVRCEELAGELGPNLFSLAILQMRMTVFTNEKKPELVQQCKDKIRELSSKRPPDRQFDENTVIDFPIDEEEEDDDESFAQ